MAQKQPRGPQRAECGRSSFLFEVSHSDEKIREAMRPEDNSSAWQLSCNRLWFFSKLAVAADVLMS